MRTQCVYSPFQTAFDDEVVVVFWLQKQGKGYNSCIKTVFFFFSSSVVRLVDLGYMVCHEHNQKYTLVITQYWNQSARNRYSNVSG